MHAIKRALTQGIPTMAKNEKKTRTAKPFVERTTKLMERVAKLGARIEKHSKKDTADKHAAAFAEAMKVAAELSLKFLAGKPPEWKPAGSATSSATRAWEVGNTCKLVKEYAFLFPALKEGKEYGITEVKKMGEGRGSKTFLRLNDSAKSYVQASQVEK